MPNIEYKLQSIEKRYEELNELMSRPEISSNREKLQELGRERAGLDDIVSDYREHKVISRSLEDTKAMLGQKLDDDMAKLVKDELDALLSRQKRLLDRLEEALRQYILMCEPAKPLCTPQCAGLCPGCGADLNVDACRCAAAADERWSVLAGFKNDRQEGSK